MIRHNHLHVVEPVEVLICNSAHRGTRDIQSNLVEAHGRLRNACGVRIGLMDNEVRHAGVHVLAAALTANVFLLCRQRISTTGARVAASVVGGL